MCDRASCWLADRCARTIDPNVDPRYIVRCVCDDDSGKLADLVESGIPQRTASLMLWAPHLIEKEEAS